MNETSDNINQEIVYLGIGSNIRPKENIVRAIEELKRLFPIINISRVWESDPVGISGPVFLNGVVAIRTTSSFVDLKNILRGIEKKLGRIRTQDKNAPRQIDIDILIYSGEIMDPDVWSQGYIAIPLAEIYPTLVDPNSGINIMEISRKLKRNTDIHPRNDILKST